MKITLTQPEIEQAVREFVGKGISLNNASAMTVEFSMGRGDNGLTAAIDVPYMGLATLPVGPTTRATAATIEPSAKAQQDLPIATFAAPAEAIVAEADAGVEAAIAPAGKSLFGTTAS